MAEVSISHVVLFIAAVSLSAIVGGTMTNVSSDVADAADGIGGDLATEISRSVTIINDPGSPVYDPKNNTLTILAKNTGGQRLPTEQEAVLVLVDGRPATVTNLTVVDGEYWRPGDVARITANATIEPGAHRVVLSVGENRDLFSFPFVDATADGDVVYAGSLSVVPYSGAQTAQYLDTTPDVVGPAAVDFDDDGSAEVPYINNGTLRLVDDDGTARTLEGNPFDLKTRVAVGTWNGSNPAVFFANETNRDIYRTSPGAVPTRVYTGDAKAILGMGDFDGDGDEELIYLDDSAHVDFIDADGTQHETGITVDSGTVESAGTPADFDGDGVVRVPFVDSSSNVVLASDDGTTTVLSNPDAFRIGIGVDDVDRDSEREVVYVGGDNHYMRYVNLNGSVGTVYNESGGTITVNTEAGVA